MAVMPPLLAPLALAALVAASTEDGEWKVERQEVSETVADGTPVRVINLHGEIHVKGAGDGVVDLLAAVQRHADDPRQPRLELRRTDGVVELEPVYPDFDLAAAGQDEPPDSWRKRRVDVTVYVPRATTLELRTLHGKIRARGIRGDVAATSESGDVEVRTSGHVEARSSYGDLWIDLGSGEWQRAPRLTTVTGEIRVELPWEAIPEARLETRGEITSDYTIDIVWISGTELKRGQVGAGSGEPNLFLESNRGPLKILRKLPTPRPPTSRPETSDTEG